MGADYRKTVGLLDEQVAKDLDRQVMEAGHPARGGVISRKHGMASAVGSSWLLTRIGLAYLTPESEYYNDPQVLDRLLAGVEFLQREQRPSGRWDLPIANYDSAPDTAFAVARLVRPLRIARETTEFDGADTFAEHLEPVLRDAADGIATGGFHTPNHRWVNVGALAQVQELSPNDRYQETIESYLAEEIDINDDGEYSERSHAIYTNVVNRHLIAAALALERNDLLDPVAKSLQTVADFLDDDWNVITDFSTRQDQGERTVPARGAGTFYFTARTRSNERLAACAHGLLENGGWDRGDVLAELTDFFHRYPEWRQHDLESGTRETTIDRQLPASGIWRVRDGSFSLTVAEGTSNLLTLKNGDLTIRGVQLTSPYFGGTFPVTEISFVEDGARLTVEGDYWFEEGPRYFEPLGRPVPWEDRMLDERDVVEIPDFDIEVLVTKSDTTVTLEIDVSDGLEGVPFALETQFAPGGRLVTGDASVAGDPDGPTFLRDGTLTYVHDDEAVRIGPGAYEHRIADPLGHSVPDDVTRVLITEMSPIERTVTISCEDATSLSSEEDAREAHRFADD